MRVIYLTHRFLPEHFRGTEVWTFELAKEMQARGNEVLVVCLRELPKPDKIFAVWEQYSGLPVAKICKHLTPENFEGYFFDPEIDKIWLEILDDFKPDLVHSTYFLGGLSLGMTQAVLARVPLFITITDYSAICARGQLLDRDFKPCAGPRGGIRCIYCLFGRNWIFSNQILDRWARDYLPQEISLLKSPEGLSSIRKREQAVREILNNAKAVIFSHPYTKRVFKKNGLKIKNSQIMDFGINFERFLGHKKTSSHRLRIGFIGQILPHKGLHILVEALSKIKEQDSFELLIYGSISNSEEKRYFESLGIGGIKHCRWLGVFDYNLMNSVLEGIELLVVPSLWAENCPLVPKYALITGTWLLVSDAPGILAKTEGEGIISFKIGDPDMLKRKIEWLIKEKLWKKPLKPKPELLVSIQEQGGWLEKIYQEGI